jgi:hypothetical protein
MNKSIDNKNLKMVYEKNMENIEHFLTLFDPRLVMDPDLRVSCIATRQSIALLREKLDSIPENIFNITA